MDKNTMRKFIEYAISDRKDDILYCLRNDGQIGCRRIYFDNSFGCLKQNPDEFYIRIIGSEIVFDGKYGVYLPAWINDIEGLVDRAMICFKNHNKTAKEVNEILHTEIFGKL